MFVSAYLGKGGAAVLPEVSMRNITLLANGRDQFVMDGQINASMDECSIYAAVPGGTQEFWAQLANLPPDEVPTFKWSIAQGTDATIVPQSNPRHLRVKLGSKPDPFTVSVAITLAGGDSLKLEREHTPETAESVAEKRRWSKLRHLALLLNQPNRFWDPLWDALRDEPMTRRELQRLGGFAKAFEAQVAEILDARPSPSRASETAKSTRTPRRHVKE
ncbi:MAG TPA: hypothetical protein VFP66_11660 [Candidatus Limnocylindrales bacterium]|nr:hypothetical protein [Candidatus Limnocylindrales bacterium]